MKLEVLDKRETIQSLNPPETAFGFTYHAHMIPPFKPEDMLILGSVGETVERLIYKIYGNVSRCAIDLQKGQDAREWVVKYHSKNVVFDYIVVDLWNEDKVCEFIYEPKFAAALRKIATGLVSFNIPAGDINKIYQVYTDAGFNYARFDTIEANAVIFFEVSNA